MTEAQLRDLCGRLVTWLLATVMVTVVVWAGLAACGVLIDPVVIGVLAGVSVYVVQSVTA